MFSQWGLVVFGIRAEIKILRVLIIKNGTKIDTNDNEG